MTSQNASESDFIALDEEIIEKEIKFNTGQNTDKQKGIVNIIEVTTMILLQVHSIDEILKYSILISKEIRGNVIWKHYI